MYKAFFDESGTDPTKYKALVMAGFLGRAEEWEKASASWEEGLREDPSIDYFKHSDYQHLNDQFTRFNRERADQKILSLATIIARFELHGFCSVAPHRMITTKPVEKGLLGSRIYDWAFAGVTQAVLNHMAPLPTHEKVDFIFDTRTELRATIENFNQTKGWSLFDELMSHAGECIPGDDREFVPLQMADLLAGEFSKAGEQQVQSDTFKVIRDNNKIAYVKAVAPVQHSAVLELMSLAAQVRQEAGQFLKAQRESKMTSEEELDRLLKLKTQEAIYRERHRHLFSFLENDSEYQAFRRRFQASTGIDPMNPPDEKQ